MDSVGPHAIRRPGWIVALADATANIVLMPIGGVLADRGDRLRFLCRLRLRDVQAAILTGLAFSGALTIHALTALAAVTAAAHAFSIPASYGLLPRFIAPRRLSFGTGRPLIASSGSLSGQPSHGWIILRFGAWSPFSSPTFICSASRRCARRLDIGRSARCQALRARRHDSDRKRSWRHAGHPDAALFG